MKKPFQFLLWTAVFLLLLVFIDQALTRIPIRAPVLSPFQEFYQDFRGRLFGARTTPPSKPSPASATSADKPSAQPLKPADQPRFIYVDKAGQLQFADRLEEIPTEFRGQAQKLEQ